MAKMRFKSDIDLDGNKLLNAEVPDLQPSEQDSQRIMPSKQITTYFKETDNEIESIHTALDGKQPVGEYATLAQLEDTNTTLQSVQTTANEADGKADAILLSIENLVPRSIATDMVSGVSVDAKASAVNIVENSVKLADGQTASASYPLPIASGTQVGLMSSEDYDTIRQNKSDIDVLKGGRTMNYEIKAPSKSPSQEELTGLYEAIVPTPPIPPLDGTTLFDTAYDKQYTWLKSSNKWIDRGSSQVAIATNATLGIVKGSPSTAGKGFIEVDGTISVYGWDDTVSRITNVEGVASGNTTAISGKVDKTTTINTKPLSGNITLGPSDVGALAIGGKAVSAGTADEATKATQDGAGNIIVDTYATKGELPKVTQNSDSISIGDTALQDASTSQDGLMTKELVLRIVALENIPNANGRSY